MRERVCKFGPEHQLVGITTEAGRSDADQATPAVVVLNAGLLHHVGQNRLNVDLARRLAQRGHLVLRFDFSGSGDSAKRREDSKGVIDRNVEETRYAMDYLQKRWKVERFVLVGLCSGADNAHRTTVVDTRVCGTVVINGYAYPTPRYYLLRYGRRAMHARNWLNFAARRLGLKPDEQEKSGASGTSPIWNFWSLPEKAALGRELRILVERNVSRLAIFSGNSRNYEYPGQFADAYSQIDFAYTLEEAYIPQADHNYSVLADRDALVEWIAEWMTRRFFTTHQRLQCEQEFPIHVVPRVALSTHRPLQPSAPGP